MSTAIQIASKSGITVGTTAVTSGTDNRLFFQSGGVVSQSPRMTFDGNTFVYDGTTSTTNSSIYEVKGAGGQRGLRIYQDNSSQLGGLNNYFIIKGTGTGAATNNFYSNDSHFCFGGLDATKGWVHIGVNDNNPQAKLDVRAQGALSTDLALRIRNSLDTANLFSVQGDGVANVLSRMNLGFSGMTTTGGALHVYAGNNNDFVSRWYNSTGVNIMSIRTVSNGSQLTLSNSSGTAGVTLDGQNSNAITIGDAKNIAFATSTGTKIGTATTEKFAFWNKTPIVQPTTTITAATFVANTSGILNDTATFDGYTMGQVVKALRNIGILA